MIMVYKIHQHILVNVYLDGKTILVCDCLSLESLVNGPFLTKSLKNGVWGQNYTPFPKFTHITEKIDLKLVKTTKECSDVLIWRKLFLANGMFSTKISLVQGIRSETGAAHLRQFFLDYPHPGLQCGTAARLVIISRLQNVTTLRQLQQHLTLYRLMDTTAFVLGLNDRLSSWIFFTVMTILTSQ